MTARLVAVGTARRPERSCPSRPARRRRCAAAPPAVRWSLGPLSDAGVWLAVDEMRWHGGRSAFQETNKGRSRSAVPLGQHVEQRVGQVGQLLARLGGGVLAQRRQLERQRRDVAGIQREQSLRGGRRTGHRGVHDGQRGLFGVSPLAAPTAPAATARCGVAPSGSQLAVGPYPSCQPSQAAALCARGLPRGGSRCAGVGFAVGRAATDSAAGVHRCGDAMRSPARVVRIRRRRNARSVGRSTTSPWPPPPRRRLSARGRRSAAASPPASAALPGWSSEQEIPSAPSAVRPPAAPATPRRRCGR